jgi:hypothetical protein
VAITFTDIDTPDINSNTDATSYATASWTPPTGFIVLWVLSRTANADATSPPVEPTVTGNGLTWTKITSVTFNSSSAINRARLNLFVADNTGGGATNGATTIDFGTQTQVRCNASFIEADGVDVSGGAAAAVVQSPNNTGSTLTSLDVTLSAASHADNRAIAAFAHAANETTTERTNWTEMYDEASSSPNFNLETQVRSDAFETTASASWTGNVACGGIAAELKADTGGGGTTTLTADHGSFSLSGQAVTFQTAMPVEHGSFS